jgi:hypothetical protein
MRAYIDELISYFREEGVPCGSLVKLTSQASAGVSFQLFSSEIFILCLERGHYFNGNQLDDRSYAAFPPDSAGATYARGAEKKDGVPGAVKEYGR